MASKDQAETPAGAGAPAGARAPMAVAPWPMAAATGTPEGGAGAKAVPPLPLPEVRGGSRTVAGRNQAGHALAREGRGPVQRSHTGVDTKPWAALHRERAGGIRPGRLPSRAHVPAEVAAPAVR